MTERKSNIDLLRSAISKQIVPQPVLPSAAPGAPAPPKPAPAKRTGAGQPVVKAATGKPGPSKGRGIQFYLTDEDRKIIHSLATWFGSQDRRVSDSQVIKAVIRAAKHNSELLAVCDEVMQADRRRQKRRRPE